MDLCVSEDGVRSLEDGGEVYEEHVESAAPIISLFRCLFVVMGGVVYRSSGVAIE